jgi:ribosome maturation factor RimP
MPRRMNMEIKILEEKVREFLKEFNYDLYDIEFIKKKHNSVLRIYIDSDKDITIDDCVFVTDKINPYLDELDPISEAYFLEVSSPGAEKILKTPEAIKSAIGRFVHIETYEQKVEGTLVSFEDGVIVIKIRNKDISFNYYDVNLIRFAIKF